MSLVLANLKKAKILETSRTFLNTLEYHLFTNAFTPVAGQVLSDFDEPTDGGYAALVPVFSAATLSGANKGEVVAPLLTWTFLHDAGDFNVVGYFSLDPADSVVAYAEAAPLAVVITAVGQTYSIIPKYTRDTA